MKCIRSGLLLWAERADCASYLTFVSTSETLRHVGNTDGACWQVAYLPVLVGTVAISPTFTESLATCVDQHILSCYAELYERVNSGDLALWAATFAPDYVSRMWGLEVLRSSFSFASPAGHFFSKGRTASHNCALVQHVGVDCHAFPCHKLSHSMPVSVLCACQPKMGCRGRDVQRMQWGTWIG